MISREIFRKRYNIFFIVPLFLTFIAIGCQHEPPGDITAMCDNDIPAGASWVEDHERRGAVSVSWFRSPMSTPQNEVVLIDVVTDNPLRTNPPQSSQDNPGHLTGDTMVMSRAFLTEYSGAAVDESVINFSCGCDSLTSASVIAGGAQTDFTFDGTSNSEQKEVWQMSIANMQSWIVLHCQRGFEDHSNKPVNINISVLTNCRHSDGSEYEVESTLVYETFSNCSHSQL